MNSNHEKSNMNHNLWKQYILILSQEDYEETKSCFPKPTLPKIDLERRANNSVSSEISQGKYSVNEQVTLNNTDQHITC